MTYLNIVWEMCICDIHLRQQMDAIFWLIRFRALLTHWSVQQNPKFRAGIGCCSLLQNHLGVLQDI